MVFLFALGIGLLVLAACASQPGTSQNTRPTLDLNAPTPTPETLPPQGSTEIKHPGSTLDVNQPTPTPEFLPPPGNQLPEPGQVKPLNTAPFSLRLKDSDDGDVAAEFYPAPQTGAAALILVSTSDQARPSWELLAQTAQVKGMGALVLELPESGTLSGPVDAAFLWLKAPENGGFDRIVVAGSGAGAGPALASFKLGPEIRAVVLFSPQAESPGVQEGLQAANERPVLVLESGAAEKVVLSGDQVDIRQVPGSGQGVTGILGQEGILEQVLQWCLQVAGGGS